MNSATRSRLNILQNSKLILGCIQSEIAQGKEVFDAYKNMSKYLGEDFMNYKKFDLFYHRFVDGDFDLNANWRIETSNLELINLPIELIKNVLERLNWTDRMAMRQTSKAFRTQIDTLKCHVYNEVSLKSDQAGRVQLQLDNELYDFSPDGLPRRHGSTRDTKPNMCIGGIKEAIADLVRRLTAPGVRTKYLEVKINDNSRVGRDDEILNTVIKSFKYLNNLIYVRSFLIDTSHEDFMLSFLSCMEPGVLEKIEIYAVADTDAHPHKVMNTEQWREAKELKVFGMEFPYSSFLHCQRFEGYFDGLTNAALVNIKNACFTNPDFEYCRLEYTEGHHVDEERLAPVLGPSKVLNPETGNTFQIIYELTGIVFKKENHFDFFGLMILGNGSAQLKLDDELINYGSGNWRNAFAHMARVWSIPKLDIHELSIEFQSFGTEASKVVETLKTLFKSIDYKIPVTSLHMVIDSGAQLEAVLTHLEPETLKHINIRGNGPVGKNEQGQAEYLRIENVMEFDQWMKAQNLHVTLIEFPFNSLLHFRQCTAFFHKIRDEEILHIKNTIFNAPGFEFCRLKYAEGHDVDFEHLEEILGPARVKKPDTGKVFSIKYGSSGITFKHSNHFNNFGLTILGDDITLLTLDEVTIEYDNGLLRNRGEKRAGSWRNALSHVARVWSVPKLEIDELHINLSPLETEASEVVETLRTLFESLGYKVPVTSLHMNIISGAQLEVVLPYLKPKTLETIKIGWNGFLGDYQHEQVEYVRIDNGLEYDQWKMARNLHVTHVELPVKSVLHFRHCTVFFHEVREMEILKIKNFLLAQEPCVMSVHLCFRDKVKVTKMQRLLGPARIEVPHISLSKVLTVEVNVSSIKFEVNWHSNGDDFA